MFYKSRKRQASQKSRCRDFLGPTALEARLMLAADAGAAVEVSGSPTESPINVDLDQPAKCDANVRCTLVVIDPSIKDHPDLISGLPEDAEWMILSEDRSGLDQIDELLHHHRNVASLHIISHGRSGTLQLGNEQVDHELLTKRATRIQGWRSSFTDDADILLYGCNVGANERGDQFIRRLSELTATDVAASDNATGSHRLGRDWVLEKVVGNVETSVALNQTSRDDYQHALLIQILAAGSTGDEILALRIDGQSVAEYSGLGTGAESGTYQTLTFDNQFPVKADQISVAFINDLYVPGSIDRNVRVDKILIDGRVLETEDDSTFSTGTWNPATLAAVPDFAQSEWLTSNGSFLFADQNATQIEITASGTTGEERMRVRVGNQVVGEFDVTETVETYQVSLDRTLDPTNEKVFVEFLNDFYDPANGVDRNLFVDRITINGQAFESESVDTYSTGTWRDADTIVPGYGRGDVLHSNGAFQYDSPASNLLIRARGDEGTEQLGLEIAGESVDLYALTTGFQDYIFNADRPVTANDVRLTFTGDVYNPDQGIDTTVLVDYIEIDGRRIETESEFVFSTGTYSAQDSAIVPGYGRGISLDSDGYFQYATGSVLDIRASGATGQEQFDLYVAGNKADRVQVSSSQGTYRYITQGSIQPADVRIQYDSDDLAAGEFDDRSLTVDSIAINGEIYETEALSTFSVGTGLTNGSVRFGFGLGETLTENGFFQFEGAELKDDFFSLPEDSIRVPLAVTINDRTPTDGPVGFSAFTEPTNGTLELVDGVFRYTPDSEFVGLDSFTYQSIPTDGTVVSPAATVTINVNASHQQPQSLINPALASELTPSGRFLEVERLVQLPTDAGGRQPRMSSLALAGDRVFVVTDGRVDNSGEIYELVTDSEGVTTAQLFLDAGQAIVQNTGLNLNNSQALFGLHSVAFHPEFETNGKFYTTYTGDRPSDPENYFYLSDPANAVSVDSVLAEWTFDFQTNQVDTSSYREVFRVGMIALDHPIRTVVFNPFAQTGDEDYGLLYIGHGDGSIQSAIAGDGQNNDALGKILRIDPLETGTSPYSIPDTNPFVTSGEFLGEIYAYGFRNPHNITFAQDAAGTTHMLVTEIGRDNVEEINLVVAGGNYGWADREGVFAHLRDQGFINGNIANLPDDDALNDYIYPVTILGHDGEPGQSFVGQAIAGSHVIQNGSTELDDQFIFVEFATDGRAYHIDFSDALQQITSLDPNDPTRDEPDELTWLTPQELTILFDHDGDDSTTPLVRESLKDVLDDEPTFEEILSAGKLRADLRLGQGPNGELYILNKRNGWIYVATNTLPPADSII